jgi:hypothetical protein
MTDHPTIAEQIDAVQWAETQARLFGKRTRLRRSKIETLLRRLEAAAETLRTLEFGSEIAR